MQLLTYLPGASSWSPEEAEDWPPELPQADGPVAVPKVQLCWNSAAQLCFKFVDVQCVESLVLNNPREVHALSKPKKPRCKKAQWLDKDVDPKAYSCNLNLHELGLPLFLRMDE